MHNIPFFLKTLIKRRLEVAYITQEMTRLQPSSATVERVFSLLANTTYISPCKTVLSKITSTLLRWLDLIDRKETNITATYEIPYGSVRLECFSNYAETELDGCWKKNGVTIQTVEH